MPPLQSIFEENRVGTPLAYRPVDAREGGWELRIENGELRIEN